MKNVILFQCQDKQFAIELRWVRDVVSTGWITPIPSAPESICGIINVGGAITPLLNVLELTGQTGRSSINTKSPTDGAIVIEVDDVVVALSIDRVNAVSSFETTGGRIGTEANGTGEFATIAAPVSIVDPHGRSIPLLDPLELIERAITHSRTAAARNPATRRPPSHPGTLSISPSRS